MNAHSDLPSADKFAHAQSWIKSAQEGSTPRGRKFQPHRDSNTACSMEAVGGLLTPFSRGVDPVSIESMFTIVQSFDVNHGENLVGAAKFVAR